MLARVQLLALGYSKGMGSRMCGWGAGGSYISEIDIVFPSSHGMSWMRLASSEPSLPKGSRFHCVEMRAMGGIKHGATWKNGGPDDVG